MQCNETLHVVYDIFSKRALLGDWVLDYCHKLF